MRQEKYKELCNRLDNPGKVFRVLRDLDLNISEKIHTKVQKGSWKKYIQDNYKEIQEEYPNATMEEIMNRLSRDYKQKKKRGLN